MLTDDTTQRVSEGTHSPARRIIIVIRFILLRLLLLFRLFDSLCLFSIFFFLQLTEGKQDLENELEDVCRENDEFQEEIKTLKSKLTETEASASQRDARVKELEAETTKLKQAVAEAEAATAKRAAEMAEAATAGTELRDEELDYVAFFSVFSVGLCLLWCNAFSHPPAHSLTHLKLTHSLQIHAFICCVV
jgi:hypothetical protein